MNPGGRAVGGLAASHRRCHRHIRVWAAGCVLVGEGLGDRGGGGLAGVGVGAGDVVADGHVLDGPGGAVGHEDRGAGGEARVAAH